MPTASGPSSPGEVRVALGHRRADERPDLEAGGEHRPAERDAVGDVRGEDDHVRSGRLEVGHDPGQSGTARSYVLARDDRHPARSAPAGRRVGDRSGVVVVGGHDRDPQLRRRLLEPRRELGCRERRRVRRRGSSRSRRPGRRAADRARSAGRQRHPPPSRRGRRRSRPGWPAIDRSDEYAPITTPAPSALSAAMTAGASSRGSEVTHVEDDPAALDTAVGIDEVGRRLDAGQLLLREVRRRCSSAGTRRRCGCRRRR